MTALTQEAQRAGHEIKSVFDELTGTVNKFAQPYLDQGLPASMLGKASLCFRVGHEGLVVTILDAERGPGFAIQAGPAWEEQPEAIGTVLRPDRYNPDDPRSGIIGAVKVGQRALALLGSEHAEFLELTLPPVK